MWWPERLERYRDDVFMCTLVFFFIVFCLAFLFGFVVVCIMTYGVDKDEPNGTWTQCYNASDTTFKTIGHRLGVYSGHAIATAQHPITKEIVDVRLSYPRRRFEFTLFTSKSDVQKWHKSLLKPTYSCAIYSKTNLGEVTFQGFTTTCSWCIPVTMTLFVFCIVMIITLPVCFFC